MNRIVLSINNVEEELELNNNARYLIASFTNGKIVEPSEVRLKSDIDATIYLTISSISW